MRATSATTLGLAVAATVAGCGGGGAAEEPAPIHPRGGRLHLMHSAVAGFEPGEALSGVASFFEPPGPAPTPAPPAAGTCAWATPAPAPTPSPTATPVVAWRDAGDSLVLRSTGSSIRLERFDGPEGEILYLTRADEPADSFAAGASYDLEIAGSDAPNGVEGAVLPGVLAAPRAVGLYAPEFSNAPITLLRSALQLGWTPGAEGASVLVRMTLSGSAGTATLSCSTEDDGFFEVPAASIEQFPTGGGTVTVSRATLREAKLADGTWFAAEAAVTEGGAVVLP